MKEVSSSEFYNFVPLLFDRLDMCKWTNEVSTEEFFVRDESIGFSRILEKNGKKIEKYYLNETFLNKVRNNKYEIL